MVGYRCVTVSEVYDQTVNTQSHLCRHQCLGQDDCSIVNYDVTTGTCMLTQEKCIDLVTDLSFELTYFRSITRDECLRWTPISQFDNTKALTSEHCDGDPSFPQCYVARLLLPPNILPAKFQPSAPVHMGQIWTVLNGAQANNAGVAFWDCPRSQIVLTASAHAQNKVLEFEYVGGNLRTRMRVFRLPPFWICTKPKRLTNVRNIYIYIYIEREIGFFARNHRWLQNHRWFLNHRWLAKLIDAYKGHTKGMSSPTCKLFGFNRNMIMTSSVDIEI